VSLREEQRNLQRLLKGKVVKRVWRHKSKELGIEFQDGMRLFVDWQPDGILEFSVTDGNTDA
jgi:hypothetical protein